MSGQRYPPYWLPERDIEDTPSLRQMTPIFSFSPQDANRKHRQQQVGREGYEHDNHREELLIHRSIQKR